MDKSGVPWPVFAMAGAALGTVGVIVIQRILPEPKPGDGFSVRWLDATGVERRLDFGENEKSALERAIKLASQFEGVEVIEIRQGRVVNIQKAGQAPREVA